LNYFLYLFCSSCFRSIETWEVLTQVIKTSPDKVDCDYFGVLAEQLLLCDRRKPLCPYRQLDRRDQNANVGARCKHTHPELPFL